MKTLYLLTARISDYRHYQNTNYRFIDTTLLSGDLLLAPPPDLLWPYKRGEYNEDQYTSIYKKVIWARYKSNERYFHDLLQEEYLCLACYCQHGRFCHRHLLVDALTYFGTLHDIHVEYLGEPEYRK